MANTYRVIHLKCPTPQNLTIKIHNFIKNRDNYMKFSEILAKTTSNLKKIDFLTNLKQMLELATVRKKTCPYTLFHISGNPLQRGNRNRINFLGNILLKSIQSSRFISINTVLQVSPEKKVQRTRVRRARWPPSIKNKTIVKKRFKLI